MHRDEQARIVKKDNIILRFGISLHQRLGKQRANDILQRMRQLARLLKQVNSGKPAGERLDLDSCISGENFDIVLQSTKVMCGSFDDPTGRPMLQTPSLGLKLGHSLAKCAEMKKGLGLRTSDNLKIKKLMHFWHYTKSTGQMEYPQHLLLH